MTVKIKLSPEDRADLTNCIGDIKYLIQKIGERSNNVTDNVDDQNDVDRIYDLRESLEEIESSL